MKWTSIAKLPDEDGRYIVSVKYNTLPIWIGISTLRNRVFDDRTTTHWMPLPEPPSDE